jgi:hypothetical protein
MLRGPLSEAGLNSLRLKALRDQPWRFSTGPRTQEGKAQAALNGRKRMKRDMSVREKRALTADVRSFIAGMASLRLKTMEMMAVGNANH